jgi:hypothetical protein
MKYKEVLEKLDEYWDSHDNPLFAIIIPTNEPKTLNRFFIPTLYELRDMAKYGVMNILFQEPWTNREAKEAVKRIEGGGWIVNWRLDKAWDKPVHMLAMRDSCARMDTTAKFYLSLDDDMKFSKGTKTVKKTSGQRYLEGIHYMLVNERCGSMDCRGFLGGSNHGQAIKPVWHWIHAMGQGQIYRNMTKYHKFALVPEEALHLRGNWDEAVNCCSKIERGYFHGLLRNHPTYHLTGSEEVSYELPLDHWLCKHVIDNNARAYIRKRYNFPDWEAHPSCKKCPVDYNLYLANGGPDFVNDHDLYERLTIEYE